LAVQDRSQSASALAPGARTVSLRPPFSASLRLIVVLNEKLLDVTQEQAFAHANDVLKNAVGGISDIIHIPGLVNVDFEDVKTVMSEPGKAMMGTAVAGGPDRATKAAEAAVACPLLEGIDLSGARGVLVLIAANKGSFKLAESRNAMNTIRRYAADDAHVIYGTAYDESLGDQLRVTVIATGLSSIARRAEQGPRVQPPLQVIAPHSQHAPQMAGHAMPGAVSPGSGGLPGHHGGQGPQHQNVPHNMPHLRTGTDNLPILTQPVAVGQAGSGGTTNAYEGLTTPSVWRHQGRAQAAAKVDALASNGMDEIEIPAFLRKQAD
jgi:cell division protein FtsZ